MNENNYLGVPAKYDMPSFKHDYLSESLDFEYKTPEDARSGKGRHELVIKFAPGKSISLFLSSSDLDQLMNKTVRRLYETDGIIWH